MTILLSGIKRSQLATSTFLLESKSHHDAIVENSELIDYLQNTTNAVLIFGHSTHTFPM